jgi:hypothetical protein
MEGEQRQQENPREEHSNPSGAAIGHGGFIFFPIRSCLHGKDLFTFLD